MIPIRFSLSPYTFTAFALSLIGIACLIYLSNLKDKSLPTRVIQLVMSSFLAGMLVWFASNIVFWGSAFFVLPDSFAIISMQGVIYFSTIYPDKSNALPLRILRISAILIGIIAFLSGIFYAVYFFLYQITPPGFPNQVIWFFNSLSSVFAFLFCIWRLLFLQKTYQHSNWFSSFSAFRHPINRQIRLMRNFVFALLCGMLQGLATYIGFLVAVPTIVPILMINLSFSLMLIVLSYSIFDLTPEQPRLIVRLIGLTYVLVLSLTGIIGMIVVETSSQSQYELYNEIIHSIPSSISNSDYSTVSDKVSYIRDEQQTLYVRNDTTLGSLPQHFETSKIIPAWSSFIYYPGLCGSADFDFYYGDHAIGSYYQYAGCHIDIENHRYEIGFNISEADQYLFNKCHWIWALILISGLLVLTIFPGYFQLNLIHPLDRLLEGVKKLDHGQTDIVVPITYQDEVGFLTNTFNKMAASLNEELSQREKAENELRQLNMTLEQRIAERTHELEALYDVSNAANQSQNPLSLMNNLLERSVRALGGNKGMILLNDENSQSKLQLASAYGLPADWLSYYNAPPENDSILNEAISQIDPLIFYSESQRSRLPDFPVPSLPFTLMIGPLSAEGKVFGLLILIRDGETPLNFNEVALLISITGLVSSAIHTDQLRQLAQHANLIEERQRLARDLHDSVTQSLYGLSTLTEAGKLHLEKGDTKTSTHLLNRVGQTTRQAIREMRLFLHQLRPPVLEQEGLINALELRLAAVEGRSDIHATLSADESIRLPYQTEFALYQIAQEALNNVLKHAQAKTVSVTITREEKRITLKIIDEGCGFDLEKIDGGGMGLENMKSRATEIGGKITITSTPGHGTCVAVEVEES